MHIRRSYASYMDFTPLCILLKTFALKSKTVHWWPLLERILNLTQLSLILPWAARLLEEAVPSKLALALLLAQLAVCPRFREGCSRMGVH